ncbi:MAG: lysylphosphatidylglycerol synthase transmembrane domain-containing protein [Chloroflexota bacterium]|nr:lysylphosphatidylglycerol synthase transmembrane domain-containing protein [Chloroflexota bacterium]
MLQGLRGKFLLSLLLGLLVVLALLLYGDLPRMLQALARFQWRYLPAILGLVFLGYLLRFLRWDYYLGQIGVRGLSKRDSLLIFFSGFPMAITPGKVGEWLKCYLLAEVKGTPVSRSAPVVVAERLSDGVAMALLGSGGLWLFGLGWEVLLGVLALAGLVVLLARFRPLARRVWSLAQRLPLFSRGRRGEALDQFYESSHILLSPKNLAVAVGLGTVAWLGEGIAFYLVLEGLGMPGGWLLVVQAQFIMAVATLAGAILLMPGGLGVAEGGLTGMAQTLLHMPRDLAATGTLLIRFFTLWFGVALGLVVLLATLHRLGLLKRKALEPGAS